MLFYRGAVGGRCGRLWKQYGVTYGELHIDEIV